ncbi:sphingosine N-acyltransferase lag1 [Vermiconidia calcicola]|uniref:Sphingosine N-acyltransferase lag1 n=1 Tax=Vermiconidia calcicola TaxID=1690605 RepID=A0ACC3MGL3_9PEZI|nr:sphingosine N-acyltransferase lag1 [Vermiconidia calcicola]
MASDTAHMNGAKGARRRRKSSSLGADPRGDTGVNSIATSHMKQSTPPRTPDTAQHAQNTKERGRKRRKAKRLFSRWKRLCFKHTWLIPLILTVTILSAYFVSPGEHNPLHSAIYLSYADPPLYERTDTLPAFIGNVTQYGKGSKDLAFVAFYMIVLSFTREFLMQRVIRPIAISYGIRGRGKQARFMEQFYTAVYFAVFGPFGMYVMYRTPVWYFNTEGMYAGFPHRAHEAVFKAYYLLQASYWAQQGLVLMLQLEKPRKDFRELVLHHIITLALIGLSYRFHFAYMGVAVYITHDISDFFLATSKLLNYIDSPITPPYLVLFMTIWAYTRHFLNLRILYSLFPYTIQIPPIPYLTTTPTLTLPGANKFATIGPYELDWHMQQYKCWISQVISFVLLSALQAVNMFWFFLILRILYRFVKRIGLSDVRSDDEDEEEDAVGTEGAVAVDEPVQEKSNGQAKGPQLVLNGAPVSSEKEERDVKASGVEGGEGMQPVSRRKR